MPPPPRSKKKEAASTDSKTVEGFAEMTPAQRFRLLSRERMLKSFPDAFENSEEALAKRSILIKIDDLGQQYALGRPGFFTGRIHTIMGEEGASKTSRALWLAQKCYRQGGLCAMVEWENAISEEQVTSYLGSYAEDFMANIYHPKSLEQGMEMVRTIIKTFAEIDPDNLLPKVIIADSVGGSNMERALDEDKEIGDTRVGGTGLYMSQAIPLLNHMAAKYNVLLVIINQARFVIETGFSGPPKPYWDRLTAKGGKSVPFHASYWEILKKGGTLKDADKDSLGFAVTAYYKKNKTRVPFRKVTYDVEWYKDLSFVRHTLDLLAVGGICGLKVARKRYWCEAVGIMESGKMEDEEIYPIIHSPEHIWKFQKELDIKTEAQVAEKDLDDRKQDENLFPEVIVEGGVDAEA